MTYKEDNSNAIKDASVIKNMVNTILIDEVYYAK